MLGCWQQRRLGAQVGKEQETPEHLGNLGRQHLGNLGNLGRQHLSNLGKEHLGNLGKQYLGNLCKQHLDNLGKEHLGKEHLTNCTWSEPNLSAVAID